jgi:lysophospholipase L1-like esterase
MLAVAVVAVVAVVLSVLAFQHTYADPPKSGTTVPRPTSSDAALLEQEADRPYAVWLGDSVTAGAERAFDEDPTIPLTASARLGWNWDVYGYGGTGYINADRSTGNIPYTQRVRRLALGTAPDVFIVMGGGNDGNDPNRKTFTHAAQSVFDFVERTWPKAQLVIVGPYVPREEGYPVQREILSAEAKRRGVPYIDPLAERWMVDHPEQLSEKDHFHPNSAAQYRIGKMLANKLEELLPKLVAKPYSIDPPSTETPSLPPIVD